MNMEILLHHNIFRNVGLLVKLTQFRNFFIQSSRSPNTYISIGNLIGFHYWKSL